MPDFLKQSKSRSRSPKRNKSIRLSLHDNTVLHQTYNSEYKRHETEHVHQPSQIRKDQKVHAEDFNVCPKYLTTTTEFDELASIQTDSKRYKESKRTDSSEKKKKLSTTYTEDRISFIHNYNCLVIENKKLWREISKLRDRFESQEKSIPNETRFAMTKDGQEESGNQLFVNPQASPTLETHPNLKHLSPISPGKAQFLTPPDYNNSKMKKMMNHSSLNFNLTSSTKKNRPEEGCIHAVQAYNMQKEVSKLENLVQNQMEEIHRISRGNTPSKKNASSNEQQAKLPHTELVQKLSHLEESNAELSKRLVEAQDRLTQANKMYELSELKLKSENEALLKENRQLTEEKNKLQLEVNLLKYGSGQNDQGVNQDGTPKNHIKEGEIKKLTEELSKCIAENKTLTIKLSVKEEELQRISNTAKQYEDKIIELQFDLQKMSKQSTQQILKSGKFQ
jgi:hypothetical protein